MSRRLFVALLALVAVLAGSVSSFAYLSAGTTAGSAGGAVAGGMSAPSNVSATLDTPAGDDVTVTWGAATLDGAPVEHYTVKRGTATVCSNVTDANRTCADADVAAGSQTYTVTAVYRGWTTSDADAVLVPQHDVTGPVVTLAQGAGQLDPTKALPITYDVRFDEVVADFDRTDITRAGTASPALDNVNVSGSGKDYTVTVDNTPVLASGTVVLSIPAGAAHDAAGNGNSASTGDGSVSYDLTGPQHALTLFGTSVGAYLNPAGTNLYYRGIAAGNFRLSDAATDAHSTVASVTYPAMESGIGWTHAAETVSTPTGGPFVSAPFSWQGNPANPAVKTITAVDALGNTSSTSLTFNIDNLAPVNGSISYEANPRNVANVPIALVNGTDAASGIASHRLQRRSGAISAAGTCSVPGAFTDISTNPVLNYSDAGVATGNCYEYQYVITDNVGNSVTRSDVSVVPVDTAAPTASSMTASNANGTLANNDRLVFAYADVAGLGVDPASIIAGWNGAAAVAVPVSLTNGAAGANDTLTVSGVGTVNLGSGSWVSASSTPSATLQMTALNTYELRFTSSPAGATTGNSATSFTWSASSGTAKDHAGNAAAGSVTSSQRF